MSIKFRSTHLGRKELSCWIKHDSLDEPEVTVEARNAFCEGPMRRQATFTNDAFCSYERTKVLPTPDHHGAVQPDRSNVGVVWTPGDTGDVCSTRGGELSVASKARRRDEISPESCPTRRRTAFQFSTLVSSDPHTLPPRPLHHGCAFWGQLSRARLRGKSSKAIQRTAPSSRS